MKGGQEHQTHIDLLVPSNARIKMIHGEGPINQEQEQEGPSPAHQEPETSLVQSARQG